MSATASSQVIERRIELLAELFLQDLKPSFLGKPNKDIGFDFLLGFPNSRGGVNTFAVEVRGAENFSEVSFPLSLKEYRRLANSNVQALLLVVDAKNNRLFYARPGAGNGSSAAQKQKVALPVTEIREDTKAALRKQLIQ
jgi:hypothetical protein